MGTALRARALLEQHELAAVEVHAAPTEHGHDLKGEEHLAVQVLMKGVPVALVVAQDQRRRPSLTRRTALREQLLVVERERPVAPA